MVPASSVFETRLVHEIHCFLGVKVGNFGGVMQQGIGEKQADFRAERLSLWHETRRFRYPTHRVAARNTRVFMRKHTIKQCETPRFRRVILLFSRTLHVVFGVQQTTFRNGTPRFRRVILLFFGTRHIVFGMQHTTFRNETCRFRRQACRNSAWNAPFFALEHSGFSVKEAGFRRETYRLPSV
jgi:hypothetical protein